MLKVIAGVSVVGVVGALVLQQWDAAVTLTLLAIAMKYADSKAG